MRLRILKLALTLALPLNGCKVIDLASSEALDTSAPPDVPPEVLAAKEALKIVGGSTDEVRTLIRSGGTPFCAGSCHWHGAANRGVAASSVQDWGLSAQNFLSCLTAMAATPARKITCLMGDPNDPSFGLAPDRLGFLRAGARGAELPLLREIFMSADSALLLGTDPVGSIKTPAPEVNQAYREARLGAFVEKAGMPSHESGPDVGPDLTDADYQTAKRWFLSSMVGIQEAYERSDLGDAPQVCTTEYQDREFFFGSPGGVSGFYVETKANNWQQKLLVANDKKMQMFGCPRRSAPKDAVGLGALECLKAKNDSGGGDLFPLVEDVGHRWAEHTLADGRRLKQSMRILREFPGCNSQYWVRSSADGRFFAGGLREPNNACTPKDSYGFILDLAYPKRKIGVNSPYDPGFFPDNEGFTFIAATGASMCDQRILEASPDKDLSLNLDDPKLCGQSTMGVYQHVGRGLESDQYLTVRSDNYQNDDGAYSQMRDPSVEPFSEPANTLEVWPFRKGDPGIGESPFQVAKEPVKIAVDYNGDFSISPSGRLIMARIGGYVDKQPTDLGYQLGVLDIANRKVKKVASICMKGGKATMNFTERFMAIHHYTDDSDREDLLDLSIVDNDEREVAFEELIHRDDVGDPNTKGSSNIYLFDLVNQRRVRVTRMGPGQYALYPHFRADGWMYFVVRDTIAGKDYAMATDAAILLEDDSFTGSSAAPTGR